MQRQEILEILIAKFLGEEIFLEEGTGDAPCMIPTEKVAEIAEFLKEDDKLQFNYLNSLAAFDTGEKLGVTYHLTSLEKNHRFSLKVYLPRENPHVASVTSLWPAAGWYEREMYDLYGIHFDGHPDLRRLLMPEDWEGHPLRKDYKQPSHYHEIPTYRPDPFELYDEFEKDQKGAK